jgi:hypothetical protein
MHIDLRKGEGYYFELMRRRKRDVYIDVRPAVIPHNIIKIPTTVKLHCCDLLKGLKWRMKTGFDLLKAGNAVLQTAARQVKNPR